MRKVCLVLLVMILLVTSAWAEVLVGSWRFTGGGELLGEGFELYADGTGRLLYTEDHAVFPSRHFYAQDGNFTWRVQGDRLQLTYQNGQQAEYPFHMEEDSLAVESLDTDGSGGYERYDETAQEENERVRELTGTEERWKVNKYYPVYQGPGKSYGRSGGGKGKVSTNDVITTYGKWRGWLLISYEISAGHHRFGWISEADVGPGAFADYGDLAFTKASGDMDYRLGVLTEQYPLTDDPGRTNSAVVTLPAGSSVHCLGICDVWMLVEGFSGSKLAMGFVPAELVDRAHGYVADAQRVMGNPVTYTKEEIAAAMDAVEQAIYAGWPGTHLLNMKYDEIRSNEEANWYADEGMQCMILYCDLNDIGLYDYEIGGEVAGDYEFVVRRVPGGDWELCNWGYR